MVDFIQNFVRKALGKDYDFILYYVYARPTC
jgi:hypothetical protein